jgi:hypothetical protein
MIPLLTPDVARIVWRLIYDGYWIDNWIYWITHSYTQLQCIHSYSSLQFTTTLAESSHCVFTGCLSSNIAGSVCLQLISEDCCLARILARNWNCPLHWWTLCLAADSVISNIAGERTTKKTPLQFPLLLDDIITGTDHKENTGRFHCCVA